MQFQVPQFIDTEDKIVGPLSLRQFGFIAGGAILSAILYFTVFPWLWVLVSIIIFAAAIALAFVKIEGRPFANVLISAFNFYWKPQTYIWQPEKPAMRMPEEKINAEAGKSALEDILAKSAAKIVHAPSRVAQVFSPKPKAAASSPAAIAPATTRTAPAGSPASAESRALTPTRTSPSAVISRATASIGSALHKSWEDLQTGAPLAKKTSDKEFLEKKMAERYQIFQRVSGDRHAAKRIDYR